MLTMGKEAVNYKTKKGYPSLARQHKEIDSGSYVLIISIPTARITTVGKLGRMRLEKGFYTYCGNAKNGVRARVKRHLRKKNKKLHWHIDYLLDLPGAKVVEAWGFFDLGMDECTLFRHLGSLPGSKLLHAGFGSSDCRSGCGAHLLTFSKKPEIGNLGIPKSRLLYSTKET